VESVFSPEALLTLTPAHKILRLKVMPKFSFPLSGLFGVLKPSGPTSMSVLRDVKKLVAKSSLFVEPDKLVKQEHSKKHSKKRSRFDPVKIGQGGTLDPLADGVLGVFTLEHANFQPKTDPLNRSHRRRKRNQTFEPILRLY